jgi:Zn-dependent peptidase ImmA (M78 family)/DNA-binding XRE family transcriptional regulator
MMRWARDQAGLSLDEAATKIGVAPALLQAWETGTSVPTVGDARKAAGAFRRPLAVLLLTQVPKDAPAPVDFRPGPHGDPRGDRLVWQAVAEAREFQELAGEIASELGEIVELPLVPDAAARDVEEFAAILRRWVGIPLQEQIAWGGRSAALMAWRSALEDRGLLVLAVPLNYKRVRGFSLAEPAPPVIATNSREPESAQIFTLFHELTHVLLGQGAVCVPQSALEEHQLDAANVEPFCNSVAGAFLIPAEALRAEPSARAIAAEDAPPATGHLNKLSGTFKVSRPVLLYRLRELGLINATQFRQKWPDIAGKGVDIPAAGGGGGVGLTAPELVLKRAGRGYVGLVARALEEDVIHKVDAARYLGLTVPGFDQALAQLRAFR